MREAAGQWRCSEMADRHTSLLPSASSAVASSVGISSTLPSASSTVASSVGISSIWQQYASPKQTQTLQQPTLLESARPIHLISRKPIVKQNAPSDDRAMTPEELAARAATNRLAVQSNVGPHTGPGSGAPLNLMISRMRGTLEKLDSYSDSDESELG